MGLIPEFVNILAVAKKYKVSISCYLQSIHQLGAMYDSLSAAICENFDNILYMGGACTQTMRFISEKGRIPLTKVQDLPAEECILITHNRVFISPKANCVNKERSSNLYIISADTYSDSCGAEIYVFGVFDSIKLATAEAEKLFKKNGYVCTINEIKVNTPSKIFLGGYYE